MGDLHLSLTAFGGDPSEGVCICVTLGDESEPRLELPVEPLDNESLEDAGRRCLKLFSERLFKAAYGAHVKNDLDVLGAG